MFNVGDEVRFNNIDDDPFLTHMNGAVGVIKEIMNDRDPEFLVSYLVDFGADIGEEELFEDELEYVNL